MTIAVVGAGYVGLTTAACLAHLGHEVVCADIDADRVARLRKGEVPILEDGLAALINEGLTYRDIAKELATTKSTVERFAKKARDKGLL